MSFARPLVETRPQLEKVTKVTHLMEEVERHGDNCCVGRLLMTTTPLPP